MIINLFIKENRKVEIKEKEIGVVGDNNATTLVLKYSSGVPQGNKVIIFNNKNGNFPYNIIEDRVEIPKKVTTEEQLNFWIEISDENSTWYSEKVKVKLHEGVKESKNILDELIKEGIEECRFELETSLETATGKNYDGKTWNELNDTVAELPIISEEQTQELGNWDLVKFYYANLVTDYIRMFRVAPKDETGADMDYRLPYIYTPKINWSSAGVISKNLLEFGVDVSSKASIGSNDGSLFSNLPKLQRLIVTGNENSQSLQRFVYQNTSLQYVKMETPSEEVLRLNSSYYQHAFYKCLSLETIDCELDFTGQTKTLAMFDNCSKLKDLRIKPFTLSTSLGLGFCRSLHNNNKGDYDSLISILNAITLDREVAKNITITFSSEIADSITGMESYWSKLVYFRDGSNLYYSESEEGYTYLELTLYEAFTNKGVTIAWV